MYELLLAPFDEPFMVKALILLLALALPAGLLGTWVVLRNLAFYTHSVGPAVFPALVIAEAIGIRAQLLAAGAAAVYAGTFNSMAKRQFATDAATALILVGGLALGSLLASDAFASPASVDSLLFGSALAASTADLAIAITTSLGTTAMALWQWRSWATTGFDQAVAQAAGSKRWQAGLLILLISLTVVAVVPLVGALLVSALLVLPAATARLWARSLTGLCAGAITVAAITAPLSLAVAYRFDLPPGAAYALTAAALFALAGISRWAYCATPIQAKLEPVQ